MLGTDFDMGPGGKGSNQAVAAARLGADSALVAMIGTDKLAGIAHRSLRGRRRRCRARRRRCTERATGVGFIILNDKGENFIILDMGANELMDAAAVDAGEARIGERRGDDRARDPDRRGRARHGTRPHSTARSTILNPAPARPLPDASSPCRLSDARTKASCASCSACPPTIRDRRAILPANCAGAAFATVVVTLGATGALILTDELDIMVPAVPVDVVDTTGAGDAFNSGFAVALAEGRDIVDAVRFGVGLRRHRLHQARRHPEPAGSRAAPMRSSPKPAKPSGRTRP